MSNGKTKQNAKKNEFFGKVFLEIGQVNGILKKTVFNKGKSMKKFLLIMLGAVMCLQLAGCKSQRETAKTQSIDTVGLCLRQQADAPAYYEALIAQLKAAGFGVVVQDGKNDQSLQDQQVRSLLAMECRLLIVEPVMVTALDSVIDQVKAKDIPLLFMDREPAGEVLERYDKLYYVGCQSVEAGTAQVRLLEKMPLQGDLNGDGLISYMILRGPEDHMDAQVITDGCQVALKRYETEQLCIAASAWDAASARAACSQALSQFGRDIEVIFCNHGSLAEGAVEAVENRGWIPGQDVYILAVDHNDRLQQLIDSGAVFGTVAAGVEQRIQRISRMAGDILAGNAPEKITYIPYEWITAGA